jgi:RNA polymerase sigma-70 factor (ECF subfamily)
VLLRASPRKPWLDERIALISPFQSRSPVRHGDNSSKWMTGSCALLLGSILARLFKAAHNQPLAITTIGLLQEDGWRNSQLQLCRACPFASLTCMPPKAPEGLSRTIEILYRSESGRILATLVRLLGDLDLAEEAMHEAFAAALETWPLTGLPDKPRPWLISAGRFKAIDVVRRRRRFDAAQGDLALQLETRVYEAPQDEEMEDDRLRLIFTCCHPALPSEGQVALTLREVCGLTTEEIARAFLVTPATLAQRIVRAKAVIRDKAIPYQVPLSQELWARLGAVLQVVYLVFNEGYSAEATGAELSREAIRLGRLLLDVPGPDLLPEPEVMGLLGLMLMQESRRAARISTEGELILLDRQDRTLWNTPQIAEGIALTESALRSRRFGAYTLQAAIAAVHAESSSAASTDWRQIKLLYDRLIRIQPSPVVELNRAVAIGMYQGPEQGLRIIDHLLAREELARYHLAHSARADLCRRLGRLPEARASYEKALALIREGARQEPERRFLSGRIEELK